MCRVGRFAGGKQWASQCQSRVQTAQHFFWAGLMVVFQLRVKPLPSLVFVLGQESPQLGSAILPTAQSGPLRMHE